MFDTSSTPAGETLPVRRLDNADGSQTIVVDLGHGLDADIHTDVVDQTLLVVWDRPDQPEQSVELELPAGEARTFMKNGVLTIDVKP